LMFFQTPAAPPDVSVYLILQKTHFLHVFGKILIFLLRLRKNGICGHKKTSGSGDPEGGII